MESEPWWSRRAVWLDWTIAAVLYALALVPRLAMRTAPPYGDEGLHFTVAKYWTQAPPNFHDVYGQNWWHAGYDFFQRPAFYVLFHPAALHSFHAFRLQHILLASLLPAVAWGLLRSHRIGRLAATGAGIALALGPPFVTWGSLVLMDTLMAILFLGGLWAHQAGRSWLAGALFLLSIWTKETAVFGVVALLAWTWWEQARRRHVPLWPLQLDPPQSILLVTSVLGVLPIIIAMSMGLRTPGGAAAVMPVKTLELVFGSSWLLPVLVLGIVLRASRTLAAWALGACLFFVALNLSGRAVEAWYAMPTAALAVCGTAATASAAWRLRPRGAAGPFALGIGVVLLTGTAVALPESNLKERMVHPLSADPAPSLADSIHYETAIRAHDLAHVASYVADRAPARLLLYDVFYGFAYVPFVADHRVVLGASSQLRDIWPQPYGPLVKAIEDNSTLSVFEALPTPLNEALRAVYSSCMVLQDGPYQVYEGWRCPGRLSELEARLPYPAIDWPARG